MNAGVCCMLWGIVLLSLPSINEQVHYIEHEFSSLIGVECLILLNLNEEFKPLPHQGQDLTKEVKFIDYPQSVRTA